MFKTYEQLYKLKTINGIFCLFLKWVHYLVIFLAFKRPGVVWVGLQTVLPLINSYLSNGLPQESLKRSHA